MQFFVLYQMALSEFLVSVKALLWNFKKTKKSGNTSWKLPLLNVKLHFNATFLQSKMQHSHQNKNNGAAFISVATHTSKQGQNFNPPKLPIGLNIFSILELSKVERTSKKNGGHGSGYLHWRIATHKNSWCPDYLANASMRPRVAQKAKVGPIFKFRTVLKCWDNSTLKSF